MKEGEDEKRNEQEVGGADHAQTKTRATYATPSVFQT
jgi:hypothetical protein